MSLDDDLMKLSISGKKKGIDPVADATKRGKLPTLGEVKRSLKVNFPTHCVTYSLLYAPVQTLIKNLIQATTQMDALPSTFSKRRPCPSSDVLQDAASRHSSSSITIIRRTTTSLPTSELATPIRTSGSSRHTTRMKYQRSAASDRYRPDGTALIFGSRLSQVTCRPQRTIMRPSWAPPLEAVTVLLHRH